MIVCIIQARLGSSRLPMKAMKKIGNKFMFEHLLDRIRDSQHIDEVIIATSDKGKDDVLARYCEMKNYKISRGSEQDLLSRFVKAIDDFKLKPDAIVRLTADCPLHHFQVVDYCIEEFGKRKVDYFSNSNSAPVLEDGCDTEVFTHEALLAAFEKATLPSDREHVTPYIKNSGNFVCGYHKFHPEWQFKLSVDNENDLRTVTEIFNYFHPTDTFSVDQIIECLKLHPEFLLHNKSSIINEGYSISLKKEQNL